VAKIRDLDQAMQVYGVGSGEFFKLENDRDTAVVRILLSGNLEAEEDWFIVHKAEIDGKERWVQCTEEEDCPLCLARRKQELKIFLQLLVEDRIKIWERGKTFVPKIKNLIEKYGDLTTRKFEIERRGAKNDRNTDYLFYALDPDGLTLEDLGVEKQQLLGPYGEEFYVVLKLSHEEMEQVANGTFGQKANEGFTRRTQTTQRRERRGSEVF
jgi:hypothetical protein